jgi:hypothetical protein
LGQRKKLLLPSSTTFSSGSKPVCSQDSHVNGREDSRSIECRGGATYSAG